MLRIMITATIILTLTVLLVATEADPGATMSS
jgi:hypothetical protein